MAVAVNYKEMRENGRKVYSSLMRSATVGIPSPTGMKYKTPDRIEDLNVRSVAVLPLLQTAEEGRQIVMVLKPSSLVNRWTLELPGTMSKNEESNPILLARESLISQTGYDYNFITEFRNQHNVQTYMAEVLTFRQPAKEEAVDPIVLTVGEVAMLSVYNRLPYLVRSGVPLRCYLDNYAKGELDDSSRRWDTEMAAMKRWM